MEKPTTEKNFLYTLLVIAIGLTLAIFWPFLTVIILAIAFAVILNPIYKWINKRITKNISWLASIVTVLLFLIVLCVPAFFVGKTVFIQIRDAYIHILNLNTDTNTFVQSIDNMVSRVLPEGFTFNIYDKIAVGISSLMSNLAGLFTSTIKTIIFFILMLLTIFYVLKDGEQWRKSIVSLCPMSEKHTNQILTKMKSAINRIFRGSFLIAIIQGILMTIGLTIFGVPNAAIWGVVTVMSSFIPTLGTSVISIPAILYLFFSGLELNALGLLIWAVIVVSTVDNILSPYLISKNTDISSLFILFSILGGIALMGPAGIFIGPLIVSLLYSLVPIYKEDI